MEFFAAGNRTRPIRLSEETREFAYRSLMHEYGLDTRRVMAIPMDDVPHFAELSKLEQYDIAIGRIAAEAPIRICEGERLSGAATLGAFDDAHTDFAGKDLQLLLFLGCHRILLKIFIRCANSP